MTESNWCKEHEPQARHDRYRGTANQRGYDKSWDNVRNAYLSQYPLCKLCHDKGIIKAADMVHHIVSIREGGSRLSYDNLMSLCWACHGRVHAVAEKPAAGRESGSQSRYC
ncbi:MAG: HNH endonuclease [Candidatus Riflebacteria bacterium]|nr:HNH endonuclease [Candidatus Riflebacteria bacterium]